MAISTDKVKRKISKKFKVLFSLKSWRALRHKDYLPLNGQRTRTNAGVRRRNKVRILTAKEEAERKRKEQEEKKQKENLS